MSTITQQEIRALVDRPQPGLRVSLFMPVEPNGPAVRKNPIRLKNLVREARAELERLGAGPDEIETMLEPMDVLEKDEEFWKHQSAGLAILRSSDETIRLSTDQPLPEECIVDQAFHVRPLLCAVQPNTRFYLLALSRGQVRLYAGDEQGLERVESDAIPESLDDVLGRELMQDSLKTYAARQVGGVGQFRSHSGIFHGHGHGTDDEKGELRQFLFAVQDGLMKEIGPSEPGGHSGQLPPLVVAGVQRTRTAFAELTRYPNLVSSGIDGDASKLPPDRLHRQAWSLVQPHLRRDELEDRRRFSASQGSPQISSDLADVLRACQEGRVEALFAAIDRPGWGQFDEDDRSVEIHDQRQPDDVDLIEEAVVRSLKGRARVYGAPNGHVPGGGAVAALFRY